MKLAHRSKIVLGIIILTVVSVLLIWTFIQRGKESAKEKELKQPAQKAQRVSIQDGESVITLDMATQNKGGIVTAPIESISHREELMAYGVVLQLQSLADLHNSYIAAKGQTENAGIKLEVSQKEYERLKALNDDEKNVSDRVFQSAEATWRSDETNTHTSQRALHALEGIIRQQWGNVIAQWLFNESPAFNRLVQQEDILVQVTLPVSTHIPSPPGIVWIQTPEGKLVSANLISPSPRTDPRIQGISFFYDVPSKATNLLPGMDVIVFLPSGPNVKGFFIPAPAIIWWQGRSWVYVQKDSTEFLRQEVSVTSPIRDGYFVTTGFTEGKHIVVKCAKTLLSEEFRPHVQGAEGEGGDKD